MRKLLKPLSLVLLLLVAYSGHVSAEMNLSTTISCPTEAECRRNCEAIGGTYRPPPNASVPGTCTLPRDSVSTEAAIEPNSPGDPELEMLDEIVERSNVLVRRSLLARETAAGVTDLNTISIVLRGVDNRDVCASCKGVGDFATAICCSANVPRCIDPCLDGDYIPVTYLRNRLSAQDP